MMEFQLLSMVKYKGIHANTKTIFAFLKCECEFQDSSPTLLCNAIGNLHGK